MQWGCLRVGCYVVLFSLACCSVPRLSALEDSGSRLSERTRRSFETSLSELAQQAAGQERLLNEAGDELTRMRALLRDSRSERARLERSLATLQNEIESLQQSNEDSQADLQSLNSALAESETALNRLESSWKAYRRTVRLRMWSERAVAAGLIGLAFALGTLF